MAQQEEMTIEAISGLVHYVANRYKSILQSTNELEYDDLVQAGFVGYVKALKKFDNKRFGHLRFNTYCFHWIRKEISRLVLVSYRRRLIELGKRQFVYHQRFYDGRSKVRRKLVAEIRKLPFPMRIVVFRLGLCCEKPGEVAKRLRIGIGTCLKLYKDGLLRMRERLGTIDRYRFW